MLAFVDQKPYSDRLALARASTGVRDAAVWGTATIGGTRVAICAMDFAFMGGSMGTVVGEKVTRAAEFALAERLPLIVISASGGARMQEGTLSLMQLAKTCARAGPDGRRGRSLHQPDDGPDHWRRLRLVRSPGRRQPRRTQGAHRVRRGARGRRARSPRNCPRASSAPSSCSTTVSSTWSCHATSCARRSRGCCATCRRRRPTRRAATALATASSARRRVARQPDRQGAGPWLTCAASGSGRRR